MFFFGLMSASLVNEVRADEQENRDPVAAKRHFKAGVDLLKIDDIGGAVEEFERAVDLNPTVSSLFNLANCYKVLHRHLDAMRTFQRLRDEFGEDLKPGLLLAIERHEADIRRVSSQLKLVVEQEGATIRVDGQEVGQSPFRDILYLSPGTRVITVSAPDHETFTQTFTAFSGQEKEQKITLVSLIGTFRVTSNVAEARVRIDGKDFGLTPLKSPISLVAGDYVIEISKEGYQTAKEPVELQPGESVSVHLRLAAREKALVPATGGGETGGPVSGGRDGDDDKLRLSPISWLGLSLTGAASITSAVLYVMANSYHQEFIDDRAQVVDFNKKWGSEDALDMTLKDGEHRSKELARAQDKSGEKTALFSNLGLGFGIAAGALAVTTAVFIALDIQKWKRGEKRAQVRFGTTPTSAWIRF